MSLLFWRLVRFRWYAWSLGLVVSLCPIALQADQISLQESTDSNGLSTLTVPDSDDSDWSFQWFIDGKALSDSPLVRANQLVLYPDQPLPGTTCRVIVYEAGTVVPSANFDLKSGQSIDADSGTGATGGSSSNSSADPANSANNGASGYVSNTADVDAITTTGMPIGSSALVNLSTRGWVRQGLPLIAGLIVSGTEPKPILIRGLGPGLSQYGVNDTLSNPVLTLYSGSTATAKNTGWNASDPGVAAASLAVNVSPLSLGSQDSALFVVLKPGGYTVQLSGINGSSGIGLIEFYDAATSNTLQSKLINISSRGYVGTGSHVMIVGFIVGGDQPKKVLIRGLGPALLNYKVMDAMADPKLTLYSGSTPIATNDNWDAGQDAAAVSAATQQVGAAPLASGSLDAALVTTLAPGGYTAMVAAGTGSASTGEALVEVYEVAGE